MDFFRLVILSSLAPRAEIALTTASESELNPIESALLAADVEGDDMVLLTVALRDERLGIERPSSEYGCRRSHGTLTIVKGRSDSQSIERILNR